MVLERDVERRGKRDLQFILVLAEAAQPLRAPHTFPVRDLDLVA